MNLIFRKIISYIRFNIQYYYILQLNTNHKEKINENKINIYFNIFELKNCDDLKTLEDKKINFNYFKKEKIIKSLKNDCIALIIYNKYEIMHVRWLGFSKKSKKFLEPWPLSIKFGEDAFWGNAYTLPKYRNKGLNYVSIYYSLNMLKCLNIKKVYLSVKKKNLYNISTYKNFKTNIYCQGIKIQFFYLSFYINYKKNKNAILKNN